MGPCFCIGRDCPKYDQCFPQRGTTFVGGPEPDGWVEDEN